MKINFKPTAAGYMFELPGAAHNGKGVEQNVKDMLDFMGADYEYDSVAGSVKIGKFSFEGVDCSGWWDGYIDFSDNRVYILNSTDCF